MTRKNTIVKRTLNNVQKTVAKGKSRSKPDAPLGPRESAQFWKQARVVKPAEKTSIHLRIDRDVFNWFKKQGSGHLTHMNAVLRSYVDASQGKR